MAATKVQTITTYTPDTYEVIHPTMERIGSVQRFGRGRSRSWDAIDAYGKLIETYRLMREAVAAVVEVAEGRSS